MKFCIEKKVSTLVKFCIEIDFREVLYEKEILCIVFFLNLKFLTFVMSTSNTQATFKQSSEGIATANGLSLVLQSPKQVYIGSVCYL